MKESREVEISMNTSGWVKRKAGPPLLGGRPMIRGNRKTERERERESVCWKEKKVIWIQKRLKVESFSCAEKRRGEM